METLHVCFADDADNGATGAGGREANALQLHRRSRHPHAHQHHDHHQREQQRFKESSCSSSSSMSPTPTPTPRYERNMGFFQQLSRRFGLRSSDDLVNSGGEDDVHSSSTDSCSSSALGALASLDDYAPAMQTSTSTAMALQRSSQTIPRHGASGYSMEHISCASSETSSTVDIDSDEQRQQALQPNHSQLLQDGDVTAKDRHSLTRASFSRLQRRSTSSLRRAFECFSLSSRSLSCSTTSSHGSTPIKSSLSSKPTSTSTVDLPKKSSLMSGGAATGSAATSGVIGAGGTAAGGAAGAASKSKGQPPQRILRQPVSYTYLKGISGLPTKRVPRSSVCCQYARR